MGARIPLPALGVRSPRFEGPLDQYKKVVQLKSLLQGQQINQAQLQQFEQQQKAREQVQQERERTQSLFREVGGDWEEFFKKAPGRGISIETLSELKESHRKDQQEYRAQSVEERAGRKERAAMYGNEAAAVLALPGEQRKSSFMQRLQTLVAQGTLQPQQAQEFAQLAQLPDEEFNRQLEMIQLSAVGATKLFEAEEKREAEKAKLTTKEKDFQTYYKAYRESKGLPRNAKVEMQARKTFAELGKTAAASISLTLPSAASPVGGGKREEILSQLDPSTRALVKGITDYKLSAQRVTSIRSGRRERLIGLAMMYDPTFDMSQYPARQRLRSDFVSGKGAANLRSLNTAIGHLDSLGRAADKLDNRDIQLWNTIANFGLTQTGDPRVVEFNNTANAVAGEMATIFKNTSGTDQEIKAWREQLNSSQSPQQFEGAINQLIELMASRMEALAGQWQSGMGKPKDFRFLNDKSEKILREFGEGADSLLELDRIGEREAAAGALGRAPSAGGGMVTMIAPDGSEAEVPRENVEAALAAGARIKGQ